jgi:formylglycine-generating enzyme required for sulfatase activity
MELVEGEDVYSAVIGNRLPVERVILMILLAGRALSFAHTQGLVHRDVKPANILLDAEGTPRITDFDLVWARDTTGGTGSGALGTFLYAAPELMHHPQDADARADVYGLGMTAVFCLHGAELPAIMMRYPARVLERLPCGDAVRKVLERAIEFEASERFPDVEAFCDALRSATVSEGRARQTIREGARVQSEIDHAVRRDLENGGLVRRAIEQAILEPRAMRVLDPLIITDWTVTEVTNVAQQAAQTVVVGSWMLIWPKHPVPGASHGRFEERGTFRCVVVEILDRFHPRQIAYQSDFFEALLPWVDIPGGDFMMGSPNEDPEAYAKERPRHHVKVASFLLAATPVTVGQYAAVLGSAARGMDASRPVTNVTWIDAIEFCNALSRLAGRKPCYTTTPDSTVWALDADGFRLPQETEWEYACRAGTTTHYFSGNEDWNLPAFAWYAENSAGRVAPVGQKRPNPWNLYDMHGNVWEWTWNEYRGLDKTTSPDAPQDGVDQHSGKGARTVRGGSFIDRPKWLRAASRIGYRPTYQNENLGFRCAGPARRKG